MSSWGKRRVAAMALSMPALVLGQSASAGDATFGGDGPRAQHTSTGGFVSCLGAAPGVPFCSTGTHLDLFWSEHGCLNPGVLYNGVVESRQDQTQTGRVHSIFCWYANGTLVAQCSRGLPPLTLIRYRHDGFSYYYNGLPGNCSGLSLLGTGGTVGNFGVWIEHD